MGGALNSNYEWMATNLLRQLASLSLDSLVIRAFSSVGEINGIVLHTTNHCSRLGPSIANKAQTSGMVLKGRVLWTKTCLLELRNSKVSDVCAGNGLEVSTSSLVGQNTQRHRLQAAPEKGFAV